MLEKLSDCSPLMAHIDTAVDCLGTGLTRVS